MQGGSIKCSLLSYNGCNSLHNMGFQRHKTRLEKEVRKLKYLICKMAGYSSRECRIFRDWTFNKVMKIARGESKPIR